LVALRQVNLLLIWPLRRILLTTSQEFTNTSQVMY